MIHNAKYNLNTQKFGIKHIKLNSAITFVNSLFVFPNFDVVKIEVPTEQIVTVESVLQPYYNTQMRGLPIHQFANATISINNSPLCVDYPLYVILDVNTQAEPSLVSVYAQNNISKENFLTVNQNVKPNSILDVFFKKNSFFETLISEMNTAGITVFDVLNPSIELNTLLNYE